jgi:hypothetical protein
MSLAARTLLGAALACAVAGCGASTAGSGGSKRVLVLSGVRTGVAPGPVVGSPGRRYGQVSSRYALSDAGGRRAGIEEVLCSASPRQDAATCARTLVLPRGQISAQGVAPASGAPATLAVVGGTGAYAGIRGGLSVSGTGSRERLVVESAEPRTASTTLALRGARAAYAAGPKPDPGPAQFLQLGYTNALTDRTGRSAGSQQVICATSPRKGVESCLETLVLRGGQIVAQGVLFSGGGTVPVVGGTGAYESVRGSLRTSGWLSGREDIVVHLR